MTRLIYLGFSGLFWLSTIGAFPTLARPVQENEDAPDVSKSESAEPIVTQHEIEIDGQPLAYTATVGLMPIKNDEGETEGEIFYIAYTLNEVEDTSERPLMFSFNGGPGSSSVWLHLGAVGPKRVPMPEEPVIPGPPYRLIDNEQTWLDQTDLVFIDPIGTGYSRAAKPELKQKFHGLRGDIESVGEFIRLYITRHQRWTSPLYLVGESYGTTRAAGLSDFLVNRGIALNGIALVSSVLNFQTVRFGVGNDLPYLLFLPTYAATAWYHEQLPDDLQARPIREVLDEVETWARTDYLQALERGDRLSDEDRAAVVDQLSRFTGLSQEFIANVNLRIEIQRFCKELLRAQGRTVGRLDSRFQGIDTQAAGDRPDFDPSLAAIRPPYTATINQYLRAELGYESDVPYHILGEGVGAWDYGPGGSGYPDTSAALRDAMARNPSMRIFIASGYYDLATPYAATEYTIANLGLDSSLRENIRFEEYESGHMMYIHEPSLEALKRHVVEFIEESNGLD